MRIEDADDPRVAAYRALREPDAAARRGGGFIVQGEVVLANAVRAGRFPLTSALVVDRRIVDLAAVLAELPANAPVYAVTQAVMDSICGFPVHRGVLAHGYASAPPAAEALLAALEDRAVVVGLVGTGDAENMGSIFRNAAAFGVAAVLLDATCCDPLYRRAVRVSVGASLITPFAHVPHASGLLDVLGEHGFDIVAFTPAGATKLNDLRPGRRIALLFGAEGPGLPAELLAQVSTVRIPMTGGFDSLNVATASGIALHHVMHERGRG